MIRLFVGLDLPADVAGRLAGSVGGMPGARRIAPANLHVTLRFVGDIDEGSAEDLHLALQQVGAAPFTLALGGLGLFGDRHHAHTLWREIIPSGPLRRLATRIESAATRAGLPGSSRRFVPHITLARLNGVAPARLQTLVAEPQADESFQVTAFTLFRSHLGRNGADYDRLATYALTMAGDTTPCGLSDGDGFG